MEKKISMLVIRRLPRYYRFLMSLQSKGISRISSQHLADLMGTTASQIRQDLNCFGGFGQQGYGYNVEMLRSEIGKIIGTDVQKRTVLIGAGNLGRTIASNVKFEERGFKLIGIFDGNEASVGQMVRKMPIRHLRDLDEFCRTEFPEIAVICVPDQTAEELCDQLKKLGFKGIWNFSHFDFSRALPDIAVQNVHLGDSLMTLGYLVSNGKKKI